MDNLVLTVIKGKDGELCAVSGRILSGNLSNSMPNDKQIDKISEAASKIHSKTELLIEKINKIIG
ncbi:MAG TPA: hypothetical protein DCG38_09660 [Eubacteriaceae bacterium]|nr:hypothetical protein [Eubacteriaceae bacterium]